MIELTNQLKHKKKILDYHKEVKTELEECFKDKIIEALDKQMKSEIKRNAE